MANKYYQTKQRKSSKRSSERHQNIFEEKKEKS